MQVFSIINAKREYFMKDINKLDNKSRTQKYYFIRMFIIIGIPAILFGLCWLSGLRVAVVASDSVSFNVAIWKKTNSIKRSDYHLFVFNRKDPQDKGLKKGDILLKRAYCLPGDKLKVTQSRVFCNEKPGARIRKKDSQGDPVEPFLFEGRIPKGKFFAFANGPMSYDSRYFGLVKTDWVKGRVVWHF